MNASSDAQIKDLHFFTGRYKDVFRLQISMDDVVRTRVFVTDIDLWQEVARAHGAFFSETKPASALIEISRLIDPDLLVEIEADEK